MPCSAVPHRHGSTRSLSRMDRTGVRCAHRWGPAVSRALRIVTVRQADRDRRLRASARRGPGWALPLGAVGAVLAATVGLTVVTGVSALGVLSSDLPDPDTLRHLAFAQPTIVYDRSATVELGRFERERRRVVRYEDIPTIVLDATTTAEDRSFWDNPGHRRPATSSRRSPRTRPARVNAAHRRSPSSWFARGCCPTDVVAPGSDRYLRKVKEILQSLRLTDAFPGEDGKRRVITRLPQRDLLRAWRVRHRGGRPDLLRQGARRADRRPGGAAGRPAEVADHARPLSLRRTGRGRAGWWSRPTAHRWSAATGSCQGLALGAHWTELTPTASCGRPSPSR